MATVVTPHAVSQAAMAARSQEFAPNLRTCAGKPADALSAWSETESPGTQTMCMSECTSMPAAWGLRIGRVAACARAGRGARLGRLVDLCAGTRGDSTLPVESWRCLLVS